MLATSEKQVQQSLLILNRDQIFVDFDSNVRKDYSQENIDSMASVMEQGRFEVPIKVAFYNKDGFKYRLIHGYHRIKAIDKLIAEGRNYPKIKAMIAMYKDDRLSEIDDNVIGNTVKEFTPLEWGFIFKEYLDEGLSQKEIAKRTGKHASFISSMLKLVKNEQVVEQIEQGLISATTGMKAVNEFGNEAAEVIKSKLTDTSKKVKGKDLVKSESKQQKSISFDKLEKSIQIVIEQIEFLGEPKNKEFIKNVESFLKGEINEKEILTKINNTLCG